MSAFRFDRFGTLGVVQPLRSLVGCRPQGIPILMYHSISETDEAGIHPYFQIATSPTVFSNQMQFLYENGYAAITLSEAAKKLMDGDTNIDKVVVITFDDGFADFYTTAFPILSRYRFNSVVFLPTAFIANSPSQFKGIPCLTWSQIKELHGASVHFGSHTVNHVQLASATPSVLENEIRYSKETIENTLGCGVESFSYPYAFPESSHSFRRRLKDILVTAGYKNGVSTIIGTAANRHDAFFLPRLPVNTWDDSRLLYAKLKGDYNWLHAPQYLKKLTILTTVQG